MPDLIGIIEEELCSLRSDKLMMQDTINAQKSLLHMKQDNLDEANDRTTVARNESAVLEDKNRALETAVNNLNDIIRGGQAKRDIQTRNINHLTETARKLNQHTGELEFECNGLNETLHDTLSQLEACDELLTERKVELHAAEEEITHRDNIIADLRQDIVRLVIMNKGMITEAVEIASNEHEDRAGVQNVLCALTPHATVIGKLYNGRA
jgi:chromosome segregation ATPase